MLCNTMKRYTHVHTYECMHVFVYMYIFCYTCTYVRMCEFVCVYLCTYARTKTHAQTLSDQNAYLFNIKAGNNNESTILDRDDILLTFFA
jgi:hypothetical protein